MEEALRLTTEYLKSRKQFGVPLSNFQTLTQRAADMYVSLELARSMNFYAAMSIADGNFDPVIAARAKLQISRSGRHIAQEAIQLHGGIGVTAEYPVGHYAARLTAIDQTLGSADDQLHTLIGGLALRHGVAVARISDPGGTPTSPPCAGCSTEASSARSGGWIPDSIWISHRLWRPGPTVGCCAIWAVIWWTRRCGCSGRRGWSRRIWTGCNVPRDARTQASSSPSPSSPVRIRTSRRAR